MTFPEAHRSLTLGSVVGALALIALAVGVGALGAVVHPFAPIAVALGIAFIAGVMTGPFFLLCVFVAVLFTRPGDFVPALAPLQIGKLAMLGALGLHAVSKLMRPVQTHALPPIPHHRWMVVLCAVILISSTLGASPSGSMAIFKEVFVKIIVLYVLITSLVDSRRRAVMFQLTMCLCTAFLGGYALYAKLSGQATIEGSRAGAVGLLGDPNDLALSILMSLPFLFVAVKETSGWLRIAMLTMTILGVAGIISTQSRGGILGMAAAIAVLTRSRFKNPMLVYSVVGVLLYVLMSVAGIGKRQGLKQGEIDESAQGRLDAWGAGARMFAKNPVFGVGYEQFVVVYFSYVVNPVDWTARVAHNSYITVAAETGVAGLVPYMALVWLSVRAGRRLQRTAKQRTPGLERALAEGLLANQAAVLTAAFFLTQCWLWFMFILMAQAAATERAFFAMPRRAPVTVPRYSMRFHHVGEAAT